MADLSRCRRLEYGDLRAAGHLYSPFLDKFQMSDLGADYLYTGERPVPFMLPNGLKEIVTFTPPGVDAGRRPDHYPLMTPDRYLEATEPLRKLFTRSSTSCWLEPRRAQTRPLLARLRADPTVVLVLVTHQRPRHARAAAGLLSS